MPADDKASGGAAAGRSIDRDLVTRALGGDAGAEEELWRRIVDTVWTMASFLGRKNHLSLEQAEDLAQDSLHAVARVKPAQLLGVRDWLPWLFTIVNRKTVDMLRKIIPGDRRNVSLDVADFSTERPAKGSGPASPPPDESLLEAEIPERIEALIDQLPENCKEDGEVLRLRFISGLSYQQIAETTKRPMGTIATILRRARVEVARLMRRTGSGEELR